MFKISGFQQCKTIGSLFKIILQVTTNSGQITCSLRFDLTLLPQPLPAKWKERGVSTVQLTIDLISAEIVHFNSRGGDTVGDIEIESTKEFKNISFTVKGKKIFQMQAKWVLINSISGYTK